jgi:aryl-alcohol dehydrogenase-like predicted oxidoreductase
MQTRKLGKTGQASTIITFGGFALSSVNQKEADAGISKILEAGINGVDVSPLYGQADWVPGSAATATRFS